MRLSLNLLAIAAAVVCLALPVTVADLATSTVIINQRPLVGEELELYTEVGRQIEAANADSALTSERIQSLFSRIADLPAIVLEDARWSLRRDVEMFVAETTKPGDSIVVELLRSPDEELVAVGLGALFFVDGHEECEKWFADVEVEAAVRALLSESRGVEVQIGALRSLSSGGLFDSVENDARRMSRQNRDPVLARRAAMFLAFEYQTARPDKLRALFRSNHKIVREEAALALATSDDLVDTRLESKVASRLLKMMVDESLSPQTRGNAIEALSWVALDDQACKSLISMLEPPNWFFGVSGNHYPLHSFVPVVETLYRCNDPGVTSALTDLQQETIKREIYEGEVKWAIEHQLLERRETSPDRGDDNRQPMEGGEL